MSDKKPTEVQARALRYLVEQGEVIDWSAIGVTPAVRRRIAEAGWAEIDRPLPGSKVERYRPTAAGRAVLSGARN